MEFVPNSVIENASPQKGSEVIRIPQDKVGEETSSRSIRIFPTVDLAYFHCPNLPGRTGHNKTFGMLP